MGLSGNVRRSFRSRLYIIIIINYCYCCHHDERRIITVTKVIIIIIRSHTFLEVKMLHCRYVSSGVAAITTYPSVVVYALVSSRRRFHKKKKTTRPTPDARLTTAFFKTRWNFNRTTRARSV